jgi:hypothetical protein
MPIDYKVQLMERGGVPQARVDSGCAWDLVDYLANQRVQVTYSFEAERLLVNFHHMNFDTARDLLDTWQHAAERDAAEHAQAHHPDHADQWLVGNRH